LILISPEAIMTLSEKPRVWIALFLVGCAALIVIVFNFPLLSGSKSVAFNVAMLVSLVGIILALPAFRPNQKLGQVYNGVLTTQRRLTTPLQKLCLAFGIVLQVILMYQNSK